MEPARISHTVSLLAVFSSFFLFKPPCRPSLLLPCASFFFFLPLLSFSCLYCPLTLMTSSFLTMRPPPLELEHLHPPPSYILHNLTPTVSPFSLIRLASPPCSPFPLSFCCMQIAPSAFCSQDPFVSENRVVQLHSSLSACISAVRSVHTHTHRTSGLVCCGGWVRPWQQASPKLANEYRSPSYSQLLGPWDPGRPSGTLKP